MTSTFEAIWHVHAYSCFLTDHIFIRGFANVHEKSCCIVYCFRTIKVMSRSDDFFELDRLSTIIPSQEFFAAQFTPPKHLKILREEKYSKHWNISFNCVALCVVFLLLKSERKVSLSFALEGIDHSQTSYEDNRNVDIWHTNTF